MAVGLAGRWHLRVEPCGGSGAENMATDAALLDATRRTGATFLRLYRWTPPGCLSFGRNEPASRRYDREAIARLRWPVVRRPTGGRAVWHQHEVTYAVAAPVAPWGSLARSYRALHALLAAALRDLGVDARLAKLTLRADHAGPCFAATAGGEVVVDGLKLVGSAQCREGGAFLQHGSILLEGSQDEVRQVSVDAGAPPAATSLRQALGRPVDFDEVAEAVARRTRAEWGPPAAATPALAVDAARFLDDAWTWRR